MDHLLRHTSKIVFQNISHRSSNEKWQKLPTLSFLLIRRSEQREFCRHLSGWTFDRNIKDSLLHFLDGLCTKHEYTRTAMIAVFQLKIRLAIDILSKGADSLESSNLRLAAIALSGFSFEKSAIWRSQCATAQVQINDPHLRALFAFLIPENGSYDKVLVSIGLLNSKYYSFFIVIFN